MYNQTDFIYTFFSSSQKLGLLHSIFNPSRVLLMSDGLHCHLKIKGLPAYYFLLAHFKNTQSSNYFPRSKWQQNVYLIC